MNLIKQERFGELVCDFYEQSSEYYMTRIQVGEALECSNPQKAIDNIHQRHKDRLDKFSVTLSLRGTDGKQYDTILYSLKGVMEICRWSRQPKADAFMDFCWEVMEALLSGEARLVWNKDERLKIARILSNTPRHAKADVMNVLGLEHTEQAETPEESEEKLLKGEVEVRDILAGLEETGVTQELTATGFQTKFPVLNKFDVREIGKVLTKIGVKKRKTNRGIFYEFPK